MGEIIGEEIHGSEEPIRIRTWEETRTTGEHKKPIDERLDSMTYIKPFVIKEVDLLTIKRFIHFCRFNTKNDWGVGMRVLLDMVDADAKTTMLYDRLVALESKVEGLVSKPVEKKKGFGVKKNE